MKKALIVVIVALLITSIMPATMVKASAPHSQPFFIFIEEESLEKRMWWRDGGFALSVTERPMFTIGKAGVSFVSNELLEFVGIKVFRLPGPGAFLFTHPLWPERWVWVRTSNYGQALQARSSFNGLWTAPHNWHIRWEELGLPAGRPEVAISVELLQFLLPQLGIGGVNILPTVLPSGEVVEEGALWIWLWGHLSIL